MVHPNQPQAERRIEILRHVMGTLLMLSLIMLIVLCFFIPSMVDSIVDQEIFKARKPSSDPSHPTIWYIRHPRETETMKNAGEVLKKILFGLVISIMAIHLLLIWGVLKKKPSQIVVLLSAILESAAFIALLIEWQTTGIYAMTVVFNFVVIVMALYMSYLLKIYNHAQAQGLNNF